MLLLGFRTAHRLSIWLSGCLSSWPLPVTSPHVTAPSHIDITLTHKHTPRRAVGLPPHRVRTSSRRRRMCVHSIVTTVSRAPHRRRIAAAAAAEARRAAAPSRRLACLTPLTAEGQQRQQQGRHHTTTRFASRTAGYDSVHCPSTHPRALLVHRRTPSHLHVPLPTRPAAAVFRVAQGAAVTHLVHAVLTILIHLPSRISSHLISSYRIPRRISSPVLERAPRHDPSDGVELHSVARIGTAFPPSPFGQFPPSVLLFFLGNNRVNKKEITQDLSVGSGVPSGDSPPRISGKSGGRSSSSSSSSSLTIAHRIRCDGQAIPCKPTPHEYLHTLDKTPLPLWKPPLAGPRIGKQKSSPSAVLLLAGNTDYQPPTPTTERTSAHYHKPISREGEELPRSASACVLRPRLRIPSPASESTGTVRTRGPPKGEKGPVSSSSSRTSIKTQQAREEEKEKGERDRDCREITPSTPSQRRTISARVHPGTPTDSQILGLGSILLESSTSLQAARSRHHPKRRTADIIIIIIITLPGCPPAVIAGAYVRKCSNAQDSIGHRHLHYTPRDASPYFHYSAAAAAAAATATATAAAQQQRSSSAAALPVRRHPPSTTTTPQRENLEPNRGPPQSVLRAADLHHKPKVRQAPTASPTPAGASSSELSVRCPAPLLRRHTFFHRRGCCALLCCAALRGCAVRCELPVIPSPGSPQLRHLTSGTGTGASYQPEPGTAALYTDLTALHLTHLTDHPTYLFSGHLHWALRAAATTSRAPLGCSLRLAPATAVPARDLCAAPVCARLPLLATTTTPPAWTLRTSCASHRIIAYTAAADFCWSSSGSPSSSSFFSHFSSAPVLVISPFSLPLPPAAGTPTYRSTYLSRLDDTARSCLKKRQRVRSRYLLPFSPSVSTTTTADTTTAGLQHCHYHLHNHRRLHHHLHSRRCRRRPVRKQQAPSVLHHLRPARLPACSFFSPPRAHHLPPLAQPHRLTRSPSPSSSPSTSFSIWSSLHGSNPPSRPSSKRCPAKTARGSPVPPARPFECRACACALPPRGHLFVLDSPCDLSRSPRPPPTLRPQVRPEPARAFVHWTGPCCPCEIAAAAISTISTTSTTTAGPQASAHPDVAAVAHQSDPPFPPPLRPPLRQRKRSLFSAFSCHGAKAFACITDASGGDHADGRVRRIPHGSREPRPSRSSVSKPAALRPTVDSPPLVSEDSDVSPMTAAPEATHKKPGSSSSDSDSTNASSSGTEGSNDVAGSLEASGAKSTTGPDGTNGNDVAAGDYFFPPASPAAETKDQARADRPADSGVSMSAGLSGQPPVPAANELERRASVATTASTQPRKLSITFQDQLPRRDSSGSASIAGSNRSSNGGSNESSNGSSNEGSDRGAPRKQSVSSISLRSLSSQSLASAEPRKSSVSFQDVLPRPDYATVDDLVNAWSRKRSISSISFRQLRASSPMDRALSPASESRSRAPSPPHQSSGTGPPFCAHHAPEQTPGRRCGPHVGGSRVERHAALCPALGSMAWSHPTLGAMAASPPALMSPPAGGAGVSRASWCGARRRRGPVDAVAHGGGGGRGDTGAPVVPGRSFPCHVLSALPGPEASPTCLPWMLGYPAGINLSPRLPRCPPAREPPRGSHCSPVALPCAWPRVRRCFKLGFNGAVTDGLSGGSWRRAVGRGGSSAGRWSLVAAPGRSQSLARSLARAGTSSLTVLLASLWPPRGRQCRQRGQRRGGRHVIFPSRSSPPAHAPRTSVVSSTTIHHPIPLPLSISATLIPAAPLAFSISHPAFHCPPVLRPPPVMAPLTETPHDRFQRHVGFDNVPNGEATKNNTLSLTLNVKHKGYQARRRSRTFMVGVDEHSYSDYAIQWLLDELVDDGDEIVCVRVIEKEIRYNDKQYQDDARHIMDAILAKNGANRAISFVLEYAVGKLHATFQKLSPSPRQIQMYQPAMLIVGTKGRSLGGIQGLVNARNSFSKYCLQYSPVPVVVVRPTEQRIKKKVKRANDSTRQTYVGMLAKTHGRHEADSEASSTYELEVQNTPDEEAHQVAKVLGLPAKFDPTIKPLPSSQLRPRSRPTSPHPGADVPTRLVDASPSSERGDSDEDEDDEECDFDVIDGQQALTQQQKLEQLHKMEVGEAAALKMGVDDDTDESDEKSDTAQEAKAAS
ncbi:hypothetical protein Purlil1_10301 [Purpureocillium lilacinum]|uniref:UspA domain-containing protein n=1 Tax=Purpureocillium lilacinum TaxID=33203 RepID=A0ABR0BN10_PURLI|nr:hypothetical protein Purlil1_10301 [Purpureocillium lilacinum]